MWCDSTTDSIVWMGEDERGTNLFLLTIDLMEMFLILYKKSVFELFSYSILTSFVKYRGTF